MIYKRRKLLPRKLKYYRIPISKITTKLHVGEVICVSTAEEKKLLSYRSKSKGYHEFLEIKDFLEQSQIKALTKQKDIKEGENDAFVIYVQNLKLEKRCENPDCKCKNIDFEHHLYDFDHIDKVKKSAEIGDLIGRYKSAQMPDTKENIKNLILQEIAKCQILCVYCHRDKTYKERYGNHIATSNYNSIEEFLGEKDISPEPKYFFGIEEFLITPS